MSKKQTKPAVKPETETVIEVRPRSAFSTRA